MLNDESYPQIRNRKSEFRNKKDGAPSCPRSWCSAYAITRETWLDRSPREKPPPTLGDASADIDRISKSQARHFSPRPANGPILVIGGENSTTILGHLGNLTRRRRGGERMFRATGAKRSVPRGGHARTDCRLTLSGC